MNKELMNKEPLLSDTPLIILGSARKESDTARFVQHLFQDQAYEVLDLLDYRVAPYSYEHAYPASDDFMQLSERLLQHKCIIFASPVYWYAMSGLMKIFFDRLTDLITIRKEYGRKLRGRQTALLAVGADEALPEGFTVPFKATSRYLGMHFIAYAYSPLSRLKDEPYVQQARKDLLQKLSLAKDL